MENKGLYINELPQSGEVTFLAVVIEKEVRPKRNGGKFLALRLADRTGELDAKVWDNPEVVAQLFASEDVVKVRGAVDHYNDKPQLIVSRIRRCHPNEYDAADFYAVSKRDPEEMFGELRAFIAMVRDEALRALLESIVSDPAIIQPLKSAPAAMKLHHAFKAGLLEHIISLCNLATALATQYPRLNLDWLIAGAILHDLGKIETLQSTGLRFAYTTRGQLIDHIALGLEILDRHVTRVPEFPIELKTILQHLIISHHGDLDKGALRRPMFPEAQMLNLIDLIDARLEQAFGLIDQSGEDVEFTSYVPSLERQLLRFPERKGTKLGDQSRHEWGRPRWRYGRMSPAEVITASELARRTTLFEIDEALDLLVQSAETEAEANGGEISDDLRKALLEYLEAFGYKVDRIANYIKAQKVEAETAAREAQRLTSRQKAAENREKRLKSMLVYYMNARELRQLRGALNTITLQSNSQPSLIVTHEARTPSAFFRATAELAWTEWEAILASLPPGALLERLRAAQGGLVQRQLLRGVLADALARGEAIEGGCAGERAACAHSVNASERMGALPTRITGLAAAGTRTLSVRSIPAAFVESSVAERRLPRDIRGRP